MNKMIIITAPSGAGKTTIVKHLLKVFPTLSFSVSATTRAPRPHESNGKEYYFISTDEFQQKIRNHEFIEYEQVYENQYYGTLHAEVQRLWSEGRSIIFDIDVKGALNLKKIFMNEAFSIFLKPPSFEILKERLLNRKTEDKASLNKRIKKAKLELKYQVKFDYVLINDKLEISLAEAENLVRTFLEIQ